MILTLNNIAGPSTLPYPFPSSHLPLPQPPLFTQFIGQVWLLHGLSILASSSKCSITNPTFIGHYSKTVGDPDHATGRPTVTVDVTGVSWRNGNWSNQRDLNLVHRIVLIKLSKISQKPERLCCYLR